MRKEISVVALHGTIQDLQDLLDSGVDVNAQDFPNGWTALESAIVHNSDLEVAKFLLEKGADPNLRDFHNRTALIAALRFQKPLDFISLLLQHGANPYLKDSREWYSFVYAKEHHPEALPLLSAIPPENF